MTANGNRIGSFEWDLHEAIGDEDIDQLCRYLSLALSFVSGGNSRVGNYLATDGPDHSCSRQAFGFIRKASDPKLLRSRNWFTFAHSEDVFSFIKGFLELCKTAKRPLDVILPVELYLAANASRDILMQSAAITSFSCLESLAATILKEKAGWSSELVRRSSAQDRLRAAAVFIGVVDDILKHSPRASRECRERNNEDGYALLARWRNATVHYSNDIVLDGEAAVEAFEVSQWLVEILILATVGYKGRLVDRRIMTGYDVEATMDVDFSRH
ncbi:hypothetical protein DXV76_07245 [Rhodobacteraceae bacterium CCMM004]|nr:hypothetical protein DXV76_07245 [Rhodobacteraceae bacterium CCMM004]